MLINERRGDGELPSKRKWWHLKGAEAGGAADHMLMDETETTRTNANNETSSDHTVGVIDWLLFICPSRLSHAERGTRKKRRRKRRMLLLTLAEGK